MVRLLIILLFCYSASNAQNPGKANCTVEIYLLKHALFNYDTTEKWISEFRPTKADLADTAFIKNDDILLYTVKRIKEKLNGGRRFIREVHDLHVRDSARSRVKNLNLDLCCGRQFAIVVNGEIAYGGFFWNAISSIVPNAVMIKAADSHTYLSVEFSSLINKDPRKNKLLKECLKQSNRLRYD